MKSKHLKSFRIWLEESNLFSDPKLLKSLSDQEQENSGTGISKDHWEPYIKDHLRGFLIDGTNIIDLYARALGYEQWFIQGQPKNFTPGEARVFSEDYWRTFWKMVKSVICP